MKQRMRLIQKIQGIVLMVVVLILAGCTQIETIVPEHRVGVEGVELVFPNFPSGPFYEGEQVADFEIDVENRGAYDVDKAFVLLRVASPLSLGKEKKEVAQAIPLNEKLEGRFGLEDKGDVKTVISQINIPATGAVVTGDEQEYSLQSFVCYKSRAQADLSGCVGARRGLESCNFEELNQEIELPSGQGGPVAITDVSQRIIENEKGIQTSFEITIQNMQGGEVFAPDLEVDVACQKVNKQSFKVVASFKGKPLICKAVKETAAVKDVADHFTIGTEPVVLKCDTMDPIEKGAAFTTELVIKLDFVYRDQGETQTITVNRIVN